MSRNTPRLITAPLALLLATLLLVVGLAGGATAAKLITGKQIKNGTITSVDLKNGSATGVDVKNGSVTGVDVKDGSLTGIDVKAGSLGPDRLAPAVLNEVRVHDAPDHNLGTCSDTGLDDCAAVAATPIGSGTWLVVGTLSVDNFDGPALALTDRCGLVRGDSVLAEARTPLAANGTPGETESLTLQQVVVSTDATPVSIRCTEMPGESIRVGSPTITALRVR
ncbi:hypothetical protein [Nocardioides lianchengensis]|uniref:Uncharacterized protein n=1 Tax=Nocardioides lianchengensis TaxID=1045774 RepID=A0A1G6UWM5_9ACTN|nr:hypothetical protein [Nocardioides lianchengensis]NYG11061.1 hypothetical protein [Nocardioides lianchengensis]SDD45722.1 hypothetical protein SAMN05421872_108114 [Nocardioides lianchengensis]